jgi:6-phosphogluconolactonase (cycloisomerase 2 family)
VACHREARGHQRELTLDRVALYAAVGPRLAHYEVDVDGAVLHERGAVALPAGLQYAWPDRTRRFLYAACSDGGPGRAGTDHWLAAYRIGPDGSLSAHGTPVALRARPVHLTLDPESGHALAVLLPSAVSVHRITADGTIGDEVPQAPMRLGPTAHQLLVTPSGGEAVLPVRGTDAAGGRAEDPGALEVFDYREGRLAPRQAIAPDGGFGFGPRHVDFHPSRPWMYMSIERQNEIALFTLENGRVDGPFHRKTTLARPGAVKPRQLVGAIHVHPSGRFAYVSNRGDGTVEYGGRPVFNGGENSIAVFSLDPGNGEPALVQVEDSRGIHPRTFHLDPSGRLLVAANMTHRDIREGEAVRRVPACLSVFRIGADGRLDYVRKYEADVGAERMFWAGMVALP